MQSIEDSKQQIKSAIRRYWWRYRDSQRANDTQDKKARRFNRMAIICLIADYRNDCLQSSRHMILCSQDMPACVKCGYPAPSTIGGDAYCDRCGKVKRMVNSL